MRSSQKSVECLTDNKNINQKQMCLSELSISTIKQKPTNESSFSFYQQNQLLEQMQLGFSQATDQYGLYKTAQSKNFTKKPLNQLRSYKLQEKNQYYDLGKIQKQQSSLHFNKQLKRKKIPSKSKEKFSNSTKSINACSSLKLLRQSKEYTLSNQKKLNIQTVPSTSLKVCLNINEIRKSAQISLKINQSPLQSSRYFQNKNFMKLYHQLPDDIKMQLNDLNYNLKSDVYDELIKTIPERKQTRSLVSIDLKRSRFSKPQKRQVARYQDNSNNTIKRSQIYLQQEPRKVVQVFKTLSVDCKSSSFYSSRTSDYQSPISKDSCSTAANRIIRRSQILSNNPRNSYQYFQIIGGANGNNKQRKY